MRRALHIGALAALAVVGILGSRSSVAAQDAPATIEYHYRWCAEDAVDLYTDCHDTPIVGLSVWISDIDVFAESDRQVTDASGNAVFTDIVAEGGPYTWVYDWEADGAPAWSDDYVASYCTLVGGDDAADIESKDWLSVAVEPGDYVVCDIYFWNRAMDPIHGGAETPNTGAGPMTTGTSAGFFLAGAVALGGLAVASRKRAFR